jgi:hypothetical protein
MPLTADQFGRRLIALRDAQRAHLTMLDALIEDLYVTMPETQPEYQVETMGQPETSEEDLARLVQERLGHT